MTDLFEKHKRPYTYPAPNRTIAPVLVPRGFYLPISDYARRAGVTRRTVYNRMYKGTVDWLQVGTNTVIIRIK